MNTHNKKDDLKTIFITGATSFIGTNLIKGLYNKNYNIVAIVRKNSTKLNLLSKYKKIKIIELDMEEIERLPDLVKMNCDVFYHLAWNGTRGLERDDKVIQQNNYHYSINALVAANKLCCKTFISAGSQAEYGIHDECITEETIEKPVTEYGKYKLEFCNYAKSFCRENNITFIEPRFFSLYGLGDNEKTLIISSIDKMLKNEDLNLTECIQTWNYLNIKDAVDALIKLQNVNTPGIYNFGSDDTRILKDFISEIYGIINSKSNMNFGAVPYPESGIVSINPCISKLKKAINWEPKVKFSDGINEILEERKNYEKD